MIIECVNTHFILRRLAIKTTKKEYAFQANDHDCYRRRCPFLTEEKLFSTFWFSSAIKYSHTHRTARGYFRSKRSCSLLAGGSLYTRESSKPGKSGRPIGRVSGRSGTSEGENRLPENPWFLRTKVKSGKQTPTSGYSLTFAPDAVDRAILLSVFTLSSIVFRCLTPIASLIPAVQNGQERESSFVSELFVGKTGNFDRRSCK